MYAAMAVNGWAWIYFVSVVVLGTLVVVNLFIAVVLNNLDEAKTDRLRELEATPGRDEILAERRATQERGHAGSTSSKIASAAAEAMSARRTRRGL